MTHQPNCDKNTKACAVSHAQGTSCVQIPCTCETLSREEQLTYHGAAGGENQKRNDEMNIDNQRRNDEVNRLNSLIESGIAEFFKKHGVVVRDSSDTGEPQRRIDTHVDLVNKSLEEFAQTIHNAALEEALKILETERWSSHDMGYDTRKEIPVEELNELCLKSHNGVIDFARAKLSALKKEI